MNDFDKTVLSILKETFVEESSDRQDLEDELYDIWDRIERISGIKYNENLTDVDDAKLLRMINIARDTLETFKRQSNQFRR